MNNTNYIGSFRRNLSRKYWRQWCTTPNLVALGIYLIIGLVVFQWSKGYLISTIDWHIPFSRVRTFYRHLFLWDINRQFGGINSQYISALPYTLYLAITERIGWSLVTTQNILLYSWCVIPGYSTYYLYRTLRPESREKLTGWLAAILAGCYYLINPFTTFVMWPAILPANIVYVFLPLIFALFANGLKNPRNWKVGFGIACLTAFFFAPAGTTPKMLVVGWGILLSYASYIWLISEENKRDIIVFTIFVFLSWLSLSAWFLIPQFMTFTEILERSGELYQSIGRTDSSSFAMTSMNLIDAFRHVTNSMINMYENHILPPSFILLSGYIPAFLTFGSLLNQKSRKFVIYFLCLAIVGLLLLNRTRYPSGQSIELFLEKLHVLRIFRGPKISFGLITIFGFTIPLGITIELILNFVGNRISNKLMCQSVIAVVGILIFLLICMIFPFPFWTGALFKSVHIQNPSQRYKIPDYYLEAGAWLKNKPEEFRIFAFPLSSVGYIPYRWEHGYWGPDIIGQILPKRPIFFDTLPISGDLYSQWYKEKLWETCGFSNLLMLTNSRYILVRQDVDIQLFNQQIISSGNISKMPEFYEVSNIPCFHLAETFDQLIFYENENWQNMQIYTTGNAIPIKDISEQLIILSSDSFSLNSNIVFVPEDWVQHHIVKNDFPNTEKSRPANISSNSINPTKYHINVIAEKPFYLVLSEKYHPGWKVYLNKISYLNGYFNKSYIEEENHFVANGFANGWYIDKQGEYDITIYFYPQNYIYLGALISTTVILLVGFIFIYKTK